MKQSDFLNEKNDPSKSKKKQAERSSIECLAVALLIWCQWVSKTNPILRPTLLTHVSLAT